MRVNAIRFAAAFSLTTTAIGQSPFGSPAVVGFYSSSDDTSGVARYEVDGSVSIIASLSASATSASFVSYAPQADRVFFGEGSAFWSVALDGSGLVQLPLDLPAQPLLELEVSPDGSTLFSRTSDTIYAFDAASGNRTLISSRASAGFTADFGRGFLYWAEGGPGGSSAIMRADLAGGNIEQISPSDGSFYTSSLSADPFDGRVYWRSRPELSSAAEYLRSVNSEGGELSDSTDRWDGFEFASIAADPASGRLAFSTDGVFPTWTDGTGNEFQNIPLTWNDPDFFAGLTEWVFVPEPSTLAQLIFAIALIRRRN